jgi:hypothetical protein
VDEAFSLPQIKGSFAHAVQNSGCEIWRSRKALRLMDPAGRGIEGQEIGESTTDIDRNAQVLQNDNPYQPRAVTPFRAASPWRELVFALRTS